ncbi:CoA transferase, partial [Myxococcota bacterium]|nr:CoA transferase [Myxococcota bacterium]
GRGDEKWLALAITCDEEWASLCAELGNPDWMQSPKLTTADGRREAHDLIDDQLSAWAAEQELEEVVERLLARGIPAATVADAKRGNTHPQFSARGFFEDVDHPVVGTHPICGPPFRYATVKHWQRSPTPTMGQHNHEVLGELGLSNAEIEQLETDGVIGTKPTGL